MVISEEIGIAKPDARVFAYAASLLGGVEKESTLMVGDSLSSDIAGGNGFGIDTCLIDSARSHESKDDHATPRYVIRSLSELSAIVEPS